MSELTVDQRLSIIEKYEYEVVKEGSEYNIPYWTLGSKGIEKTGEQLAIKYIRGVTNDPNWPKQDGILNEALLALAAHDLYIKNKEVPNEHTSQAIYYINLAMEELQARQRERILNNTLNTSKQ